MKISENYKNRLQKLAGVLSENSIPQRKTFWAWISPNNQFYEVPKLNHKGFIMSRYKEEWDYDKVFNMAIKDGWVRVICEYFPQYFKTELSLNSYSLERIKDVLQNLFLPLVKYGNNIIYIDSDYPSFSKTFSTFNSEMKDNLLNFMLSENSSPQTLPPMQSMLPKYSLRYPKNNKLIIVNINKLLDKHNEDEPNYAFDSREKADYPSRIDRAKEYWLKYAVDQRPISPKDGLRKNWGNMTFEAPYVSFTNGKLGFSDGRHRTIAMKELGYDNIIIEIPKSQENLFKTL